MTPSNEESPLAALGYTPFESSARTELDADGGAARVTRCDRTRVRLVGGGYDEALVPKRLRGGDDGPLVAGDWVLVEDSSGDPVVSARFPRRTRLVRGAAGTATRSQVIAANVDRIFVVMGLDEDFQPRRLERYLALIADAGLEAVVFLTKAAACADVEARVDACKRVAGADFVLGVHAVDVVAGVASELPASYLDRGLTVALVGSSGAGKSTLINHIAGEDLMKTRHVRESDGRGQHTTTHRELVVLPGGALLVDNPGMRELSLWLEGDGLGRVFDEVEEVARGCRFSDCSHQHEPGCAVRDAVARGELDEGRVDRFARLRDEAETTRRRRDERLRRADERALAKIYRSTQKRGRRRKGD